MFENHQNNSSILCDSVIGVSTKSRHHKKSIYKNIKQTELNLKQIRRYEQKNILPFSLRQQQQQININNNSYQLQNPTDQNIGRNTQEQLGQSDISQKLLKRFESRNFIGLKTQDNFYQQKSSYEHVPQKNEVNSIHEQKIQLKNSTNLIMLQIHLTIAKKKYTLKVSNQITSQDLQEIIENFLIENSISNPSKKSHFKTKSSIIKMVQNKINDGNSNEYKKLIDKTQHQQKLHKNKQKITDENNNQSNLHINNQKYKKKQESQINDNSPAKNIKTKNPSHQKSSKFQKPIIHQKQQNKSLITQNDSINYEQNSEEQEQACSPSFKSSAYVDNKSQFKKTSHFSSEPKHRNNKYQKIVVDYYNEKIGSNLIKQKENKTNQQSEVDMKEVFVINQQKKKVCDSHHQNKVIQSAKTPKNHLNSNDSQYSTQQQKVKSVYEKWKQRQKSKQISGKNNDKQNFTNALKQRRQQNNNSFLAEASAQKNIQKRQKNWNNTKISRGHSNSNLSINTYDMKQNDKRIGQKSSMNRKIMNKQNSKINRSSHLISKSPHHERNRTIMDESYSPNQFMNRTQIVASKSNEIFQNNKYIRGVKQTTERQMTPGKTKPSPNQPKTPTNYQNQSKVYTIYDEDQYPIHQLSPDHFYKQGLVFEAKKKQQIQDKFKSLYPFTTRNLKEFNQNQNGGSRNGTMMKNAKQSNGVSSKSKQKYFSSKLSINKNSIANKSCVNLMLDQKEKSALHQRLYQQNKIKQVKITATQAGEKFIKITKVPQSENQIKIMEDNLNHIKGLSREKRVKLIEKNIKIKEKLKEKDRIIDEELQKMIKQGKVKPTCQIVQVRKSPFRKTKIY